jgi:hypothetical protein
MSARAARYGCHQGQTGSGVDMPQARTNLHAAMFGYFAAKVHPDVRPLTEGGSLLGIVLSVNAESPLSLAIQHLGEASARVVIILARTCDRDLCVGRWVGSKTLADALRGVRAPAAPVAERFHTSRYSEQTHVSNVSAVGFTVRHVDLLHRFCALTLEGSGGVLNRARA